jgi:foldase protein PrsA
MRHLTSVSLMIALLLAISCAVAYCADAAPPAGEAEEAPPVRASGELPERPELETMSGVEAWVVNGERITADEVREEAYLYSGPYVLQDMVAELLLRQEARRRDITLTEEDVDAKVRQLREEFGLLSEASLRTFLSSKRRTGEWLLSNARQYALMEKVLSDQVYVSDREAEQHYNRNAGFYRRPETVEFRIMSFGSEEQAAQARAQIGEGKSFEEVAKQAARSAAERQVAGELRHYARGQQPALLPELEAAIFAAPLNQVTGPVQCRDIYYLIRVEKKTDPYQPSFNEVRGFVRERLRRQKLEQVVWPNWIRMQLANAEISVIQAE